MLREKLKRVKDRAYRVICNQDIACGFFWGATFSAVICILVILLGVIK